MTAEHGRLREANERGVPWRKWGPYLRDCARPGAHARSGNETFASLPVASPPWAYQCSADGPAGICDEQMQLCFAIALRSGEDCALQGRLPAVPMTHSRRCTQADNLPTHSYMRTHGRYRQSAVPTSGREAACFDVVVEYAKSGPDEILIQIELRNLGCETATLQVLPQLWTRPGASLHASPAVVERAPGGVDVPCLIARHPELGSYYLHCELAGAFLFAGMRAAAHYVLILAPRAVQRIRMLLTDATAAIDKPALDKLFCSIKQHRQDADEFFSVITYACDSAAGACDARRAFCNMLWNKTVWMSAFTGWLQDRREGVGCRGGDTCATQSFRLRVAQVVAPPCKRECPHPESPAWLLHTLALACVDAGFAAQQMRSLLRGELRNRGGAVGPVYHEWQALKPWAALLMYQLQRPRRPKDAHHDLADSFEALSSQFAGGGWAAIRAQSMLEMALELAAHDARYEQRAIECYVSFVAAVAALDCEASLLDPSEAEDEDPGIRLIISEAMQFQVISSLGLLVLSGAVAFPPGSLAGLPRFCERLRAIHREHTGRICQPQHLRDVLQRVFGKLGTAAWSSLGGSMLLIRALARIEKLYGPAIRVPSPLRDGSMWSPTEVSKWIVHQHVAARVDAVDRVRLLDFCDYVYLRGAANAGQRTGWAGRVAAMVCACSGYRPFDRDNLDISSVIEPEAGATPVPLPSLKLSRR
jgi:hypothetical protein